MGPGRPDGGTLGVAGSEVWPVDSLNVTAAVQAATRTPRHRDAGTAVPVTLALQGYGGAMMLQVHVTFVNGSSTTWVTGDGGWQAIDADPIFNPTNSTAAAYHQPMELTDARVWPVSQRNTHLPVVLGENRCSCSHVG